MGNRFTCGLVALLWANFVFAGDDWQAAQDAFQNNEFKVSVDISNKLLKAEPDNERYRLHLGLSYFFLNQLPNAVKVLKPAFKNPDHQEVSKSFLAQAHGRLMESGTEFLSRGNWTDAKASLVWALAADPTAEAKLSLATACLKLGEIEQAVALAESVKRHPRSESDYEDAEQIIYLTHSKVQSSQFGFDVSAGMGANSNIAWRGKTEHPSGGVELRGSADVHYSWNPSNPFQTQTFVHADHRRFPNLTDENLVQFMGGQRFLFQFRDWTWKLDPAVSVVWVSSILSYFRYGAFFEAENKIEKDQFTGIRLAAYRVSPQRDDYDSLTGTAYSVSPYFRWNAGTNAFSIAYVYGREMDKDQDPSFFLVVPLSYYSHSLSFTLEHRFSQAWSMGSEVDLRYRIYEYRANFSNLKREDQEVDVSTKITHHLDMQWSLSAEGEWTKINSTYGSGASADKNIDQKVGLISVRYLFP